jgi:probable rRNA maturation factor
VSYKIHIQNVSVAQDIPHQSLFKSWIAATLKSHYDHAEMTIRIVDEDEIAQLNQQYRNKKGPTNILSFPYKSAVNTQNLLKGDLVICGTIVLQEAKSQNKSAEAHWAHLIIHGTLHLLGYDHVTDKEANNMEHLEIGILKSFGFADPYQEHINGK